MKNSPVDSMKPISRRPSSNDSKRWIRTISLMMVKDAEEAVVDRVSSLETIVMRIKLLPVKPTSSTLRNGSARDRWRPLRS